MTDQITVKDTSIIINEHLRHYINERLEAADKYMVSEIARLVQSDRNIRDEIILRASHDEMVAHKADVSISNRFDAVNEFRKTLSDQTNTFVTRAEVETRYNSNSDKIIILMSRLDKIEGKSGGLNAGWSYLLGALVAIGSLITIVGAVISLSITLHK